MSGRLIGVKSIAIGALAATAVGTALATGTLDHLEATTAPSAFAIGLFASMSAALVIYAARPRAKSRAALGRHGLAVDLVPGHPAVRELPSIVQRVLYVAMFACLGLATFSHDATARIANAPEDFVEPSRAAYCFPPEKKPDAPAPVQAPEPPPVDQAGCALVKRAFALGYAKSLGTCAPREAPKPVVVAKQVEEEVCDRRELDEPFLHYTWRRLVDFVEGASPVDSVATYTDDMRTRVDYLADSFADVEHSITGTPHGAHHVFITLPDPHPRSVTDYFTGHEPCTSRFAELPLWPPPRDPSLLVEHVLGQLLFATRFGTPASCSDYVLHWDAPKDTCARIAADPDRLDESIADVLDRRQRQAALRELALALGEQPTQPAPPPARAVASVACFVVGEAAPVTGRNLAIDGETIQLREVKIAQVTAAGAGPLDVYKQLAQLLAGVPSPKPRATEPYVPGDDFPLARLEPLVELDPFVEPAARAALEAKPEVYPIDLHLHAFVDGFRRLYFAQRGRL